MNLTWVKNSIGGSLDSFPVYFPGDLRDRLLIPQVLFFSVGENGGEGVETSENLKLEEKPEENGGRGGTKTKKTCGK